MSKAVMQQALDAINGGLYRSDSIIKAISALESALAQPEQENECNPYDLCAGCRCAYSRLAQPEQDYIKKLEDDYRKQLDELSQRNYELRHALAKPEIDYPPECTTPEMELAYAAGWWKALEVQRQQST